jgi:6-phosphogluconolactonase
MSAPKTRTPKLVAYVGSYADGPGGGPGGIDILDVDASGRSLTSTGRVAAPLQAGYLAYSPGRSALYAVDERKTDGKGPVGPPAAVHAFAVDPRDGRLTALGAMVAPGPFPTFLAVDPAGDRLVSAHHGSFDHVEHVVETPSGWEVEYLYDDSTVVLFAIEPDGSIGRITDLKVFAPGGTDPNRSPQAGGHGQASGHAHCAVIDPAGRHVLVCDKAADHLTVFALQDTLTPVSRLQLPPETGPRHLAFGPVGDRAYVTCEFSSTLLSLAYDAEAGTVERIAEVSTVADGHDGPNEPADVRVHPSGRWVYVNNRGEDSLAWFETDTAGGLRRAGHVPLADSPHPGLAARSFSLSPDGSFLLVADRPANLVRSYAVDEATGALAPLTELAVPDPAFIVFAELTG